mmetsp:Transcript_722/g.2862  ORF Transcript_722/g.2862 Transcript_722/m.2862 type:complete len:391 (+) Transcript_722:557-1729(+)
MPRVNRRPSNILQQSLRERAYYGASFLVCSRRRFFFFCKSFCLRVPAVARLRTTGDRRGLCCSDSSVAMAAAAEARSVGGGGGGCLRIVASFSSAFITVVVVCSALGRECPGVLGGIAASAAAGAIARQVSRVPTRATEAGATAPGRHTSSVPSDVAAATRPAVSSSSSFLQGDHTTASALTRAEPLRCACHTTTAVLRLEEENSQTRSAPAASAVRTRGAAVASSSPTNVASTTDGSWSRATSLPSADRRSSSVVSEESPPTPWTSRASPMATRYHAPRGAENRTTDAARRPVRRINDARAAARSQSRSVRSAPADRANRPDGWAATAATAARCPPKTWTHSQSRHRHSVRLESSQPTRACFAPQNATARIVPRLRGPTSPTCRRLARS